jgi:hypothetical protein
MEGNSGRWFYMQGQGGLSVACKDSGFFLPGTRARFGPVHADSIAVRAALTPLHMALALAAPVAVGCGPSVLAMDRVQGQFPGSGGRHVMTEPTSSTGPIRRARDRTIVLESFIFFSQLSLVN